MGITPDHDDAQRRGAVAHAPADADSRWRGLAQAIEGFPSPWPPHDPEAATRWEKLLEELAELRQSGFALLGRPEFVDQHVLGELQSEAAAAWASGSPERYRENDCGQAFSDPGPHAKRIALDHRWPILIGAALGINVRSARFAAYIHYNRAQAQIKPHVDFVDSDVSVLLTVDRFPTSGAERSALVLHPAGRQPIRTVLESGEAIALQGHGLVHGREPVKPGEWLRLLFMAFVEASPTQ